jgi:ADP-ribose pyrophosphatase YjhB (NUDIX family)
MKPGPETPVVGVGVVILDQGRLLVVRRAKEPGKGLWAVPGGKVNAGEPLRVAAARETLEETGLVVEVGEVAWVGEHINGKHHIVLIDFFAEISGGEAKPGDDADELAWVSVEDPGEIPVTLTMHQLLDTLRS